MGQKQTLNKATHRVDSAKDATRRRKTAERHAKNREANEARHQANLATMRELGIQPERVKLPKRENVYVTKTQGFSSYVPSRLGGGMVSRSVRPSKLLRRARRGSI